MAPLALTVQFLNWVADRPRNYADTMEAWHTTCPRLTVWEDAVIDGLIRLESGTAMKEAEVLLTARGRRLLKGGRVRKLFDPHACRSPDQRGMPLT